MRMCICRTIKAFLKFERSLGFTFNSTIRNGIIRRLATKPLMKCIMQASNEHLKVCARACTEVSPCFLLLSDAKLSLALSRKLKVSCKKPIDHKETVVIGYSDSSNYFPLLPEEQRNSEVNKFYLKSCPAN